MRVRSITVAAAVIAVVLALLDPAPAAAAPGDRIALDDMGQPTTDAAGGVFLKVIVKGNGAPIYETDTATEAASDRALAFTVYHQLWVDNDKKLPDKGGRYRVGASDGTFMGWIDKDRVVPWNTRCALEARNVGNNRKFQVFSTETKKALPLPLPGEDFQHAVLLKKPPASRSDPVFDVIYYLGEVAGATKQQRPPKADEVRRTLKLEIVFVIDSTNSMTALIDGTKEVIRRTATEIVANPELKRRVRLGLVTYQDCTPLPAPGLIPSRIVSKLTDDFAAFQDALKTLRAAEIGSEEIEEDVVAGLKMAVEESGWEEISSKHIILLGDASTLLGRAPTPEERKKPGSRFKNTTGLALEQILDLAHPQGGGDLVKTLAAKNMSAIRAKQPVLPGYSEEDKKLIEGDAVRCAQQFKLVAANKGTVQGKYLELDPTSGQEVDHVVTELTDWLLSATAELQRIIENKPRPTPNATMIKGDFLRAADPTKANLWKIEECLTAEQLKEYKKSGNIVVEGYAPLRDSEGRELAVEKVIVYREQVERVQSSLDSLYRQFKRLTVQQRRNPENVVFGVRIALATELSGQAVTNETQLRRVLRALPLSTKALDYTPVQVSTMDETEWTAWLEKLKLAADRAEQLLNSTTQGVKWNKLTLAAAVGNPIEESFVLIFLNQLP